jgi:phosphoglycerate dehydrogenase-like enzyme
LPPNAAGTVRVEVTLVARTERASDPEFGRVRASYDLATIAAQADWLVLALPLTSETRGLVGRDVLAALPSTVRLINVGRGAVIDEAALVEALRDGRLAGAALDVFEHEPLPRDHPLWAVPNVVVSPHMAGDVHGWLGWFTDSFVANLERWLTGRPLENVVDKRLGYVPGSPDA